MLNLKSVKKNGM